MTVHLTYTSFDGKFRTMLDSSLYLPQCWHDDRERCREAKIPDDLVYRPKYEIALEQLDRAAADGVHFAWITADEWYTQKPTFVQGLEGRGMRFVLETPKNFALWLHDPRTGTAAPAKPVESLCRYSRVLMRQPWQRYHIKDTEKGPMVWEVKYAPCWLPRGGGVVGPYWLIVARNALDPDEIKYFISNAAPGVPLPAILHVAFGRWPVERCLQDEKSELGLSHFEVRCYPALKRHLLITQVSHLFLARQTQRLRGEKPRVDFATGAYGDQCPPGRTVLADPGAGRALDDRCGTNRLLASEERPRSKEPHENTPCPTGKSRHRPRTTSPLPSPLNKQSAL